MAASWCKVASNLDSHPKIRRAGRDGREVFLFALRRNAEPDNPRPGFLPTVMLEPWYLADQLMMSEEEARNGLSRAVTAGLLRIEHDDAARDGGFVEIIGWDDEWAKRPLTVAERQARHRAKTNTSPPESPDVTDSNAQIVTGNGSNALEERREEEIRAEEKRERATPAKPSRSPKSQLPDDWKPARSEPNDRAWRDAKSRGVDCMDALARMRDHARSNAWRKVDWDATWRNWLRNSRPFASGTGQHRLPTPLEQQLERVRMLEAEEANGGEL